MATKTIPKTSDRKTQKEATASQPAGGERGCGMKKAMISVGLIEQLGDLELALISLTHLAERVSRLDETTGSSDCDSVATLLRMILDDFQNVVLRMQCEATESSDLQLLTGGAV